MTLWILRLVIVLFFLVMFLWRSKTYWGMGLLAASSIVLLDALREQGILADVGYLTYLFGGLIAAAAFMWFNGVFGRIEEDPATTPDSLQLVKTKTPRRTATAKSNGAIDNQMIFDQIRTNLNADDVRDLVFDLELHENDIVNPNQDMHQVILNLMESAESAGHSPQLAMAVERILTPVPRENLPRLERISAETPPALLRQFIVTNYNLRELAQITTHLGVDWEELGTNSKKSRVRELLLYLRRRNRTDELILYLHELKETTFLSDPV